ncbi:MAG: shikimate kinase [Pirellulales bacterium]
MNLVLIGMRGTGKSTVARLLAERLAWPWFDADAQIERRAGKPIAAIFADDGEMAFRDWESRVVADLAARDRAVLALGGGAVVRAENRAAIAVLGRVVWLTASPETLLARIEADHSTAARRPNLSAAGGITEIIATLDARRAVYRQCAHLEVDTEGKTPAQVADAIIEQLNLVP